MLSLEATKFADKITQLGHCLGLKIGLTGYILISDENGYGFRKG